MMNQVGLGEDTAYIGLLPKFLAVPTDLWATGQILVGPTLYESNMPSGQPNPVYKYKMECIPSPYLHANSSAAWYLFSSPMDLPCFEVAFLQGTNRRPELFQKDQVDPDGRVFHVRLDIAAAVIAWQGALKNDGA